ncbi:MAG: hypothetical protein JRD68_10625 [Deltaproteobacteria bacterium]|nr:hypothetical protein [Deltaproteobacteria bacterium]
MNLTSLKRFSLITIIALVILTLTVEYRAGSELKQARDCVNGSDINRALTHYSRALNWYVPLGSAGKAAEELLALGLDLKARGDTAHARLALSRLRAGLYGSRGLYTPKAGIIRRAEPHLAELMALAKLGEEAEPSALKAQAGTYLALLSKPAQPSTGPGLAASAGFLIWTAAILLFIFRSRLDWIPVEGGRSRTLILILICGLGFAVWLAGMIWA